MKKIAAAAMMLNLRAIKIDCFRNEGIKSLCPPIYDGSIMYSYDIALLVE